MLLAGVTHPTTLAFFVLTLFFIAAARLVFRKLALRSVLRDDGPMLLTAVLAAICTYAIWKVGIWGPSESLSEAALSPPYSSGFFIGRMMLWVAAMRPALNGVLFAIGAIALLAVGRGMVEDELPRISLGWLLPLVGLFGFVGGLTYPYYRFFNTTMAIPLLIGVGAYFALRLMFDWIERGGVGLAGIVGVLAVVFVLVTNFSTGLMKSGWTKPGNQWIDIDQRKQLSLLRGQLEAGVDPARPVVFVIDEETSTFQIWGFTKLSGNTSRFGLPRGQIDKGYLYLGSLDNYLAGRPTLREGQETYNKVSRATARGTQHVAEVSGRDPLVVVVQSFNATASNADVASGRTRPPAGGNVWVVNDHGLTKYSDGRRVGDVPLAAASTSSDDGGLLHILRIAGALLLLALPGWLAFRFFVPGGGFALGLGMVPALASAILTFVGTIALAVARSPFSGAVMWISVIVSILLAAALRVRARLAPQHVPDSLAL
jgi:hypothetical protein